jgi:hypothetical protein
MSWVKLLVLVVTLIKQFTTYLHDKGLIKEGETKAVAEALSRAQAEIALVVKTTEATQARHNADSTDAAFDNEFQRKD